MKNISARSDAAWALESVNRGDFLPTQYKHLANEDTAVPVADGITVPPASMTALVLDLLELHPDDKVLEIGTGSGYQTAVLSRCCAEVISVEVVTISAEVGEALHDYKNVTLYSDCDGRYGPVNEGEFDAILVTAGSDRIYDCWSDVLAEGGRLVLPLGADNKYEVRKFVKRDGKLEDNGTFAYVNVVPLRRG